MTIPISPIIFKHPVYHSIYNDTIRIVINVYNLILMMSTEN